MNSQSESEPVSGQTQRPRALRVYTACVSGLGVSLIFWSLTHLPSALPEMLLFIGLVVITEWMISEAVMPQLAFSMSSAVYFAALLLLGLLPSALAAMIGGLAATLVHEMADRRRGRPRAPLLQRCLFNTGAVGLSVVIGWGVYLLTGGRVGEVANLSNLLPTVLAAATIEFMNAALVVGVVSLQIGQPALQVWKQNMSWAVPMNILGMVVGGGGLALGYEIAGVLGLVVFFLPIALTIYAFRLYVGQTKAQMDRLEEIIAERTEDLRQANEELKRLDRVKMNFFSVINHEMRTPLSAVIGYTDVLLYDAVLSPQHEAMLSSIKESSQRLLDLVNNLLDISRLEDGELNISPQTMGVVESVGRALSVVNLAAEKKHISIAVDIPKDLPSVRGDPKRVDQILINLLGNAVKYTPDTGSVVVAAKVNETTNMVEISVTDNGIGIPEDMLPYIFDRYSRVERAEVHHTIGSGLGLSIAKALVNAHGGEIWVEGEEGYGSTFTFSLPPSEQLDAGTGSTATSASTAR
jgi:signal transduction histidine kinase